MAKTNWQMGDTVLPEDMNGIGREINSLADELGDMTAVPTDAKTAAGAIGELMDAIENIDPIPPDGSITDNKIGDLTISDSNAPSSDTAKLSGLLGFIAYMIKAITGKSNWRTAPTKSLEGLNTDKADKASPTFTGTVTLPSTTSIGSITSTIIGYLSGLTSNVQTQLNAKATLASPALTGTPTVPTAAVGTNNTQAASTEFVQTAAANAAKGASGSFTLTDKIAGGSSVTKTIPLGGAYKFFSATLKNGIEGGIVYATTNNNDATLISGAGRTSSNLASSVYSWNIGVEGGLGKASPEYYSYIFGYNNAYIDQLYISGSNLIIRIQSNNVETNLNIRFMWRADY